MHDTRPDSDIIEQIVRNRDPQAYAVLVTRYERSVLGAVLPIVRDLHAAQDVVQDAFVRAYASIRSLREPSRFGPWLVTIAEREAMRVARNRRESVLDLEYANASVAAPLAPILDDERKRLLDAVRQLPAHERAVVSLRYFDAHGVNEISRITGRSVGTVTKQLSRALQRLREHLQPEDRTWPARKSMNV